MTPIRAYRIVRYLMNILFALVCVYAFSANASELPNSVGIDAVALAKKIEADNLYTTQGWLDKGVQDEELEPARRLTFMRRGFASAFVKDSREELLLRAKQYSEFASSYGTKRDEKVGQLLFALAEKYDKQNRTKSFVEANEAMAPFLSSDDWFVQLWALAFKWELEIGLRNTNAALQSAQEALKLVPNENTEYALEARIMSLEGMSYLYNIMRNPELGLEMSKRTIDLQIEADMPVDGASIINNLIYSFNVWRDHETAKQLVEILLRLEEKTQNGVPGLTDMRAALIHNELGNYKTALFHSERSIKNTQIPSVLELASINRIIALVGTGRVQEGETLLAQYLTSIAESGTKSKRAPLQILYAHALVSMRNGDHDETIRLMNQRLDKAVQYNLAISNSDSANMLASLQNSKGRQDERENALKRETALQQIALDRQKRANNLLIIIAIIFAVAAVIAIAFARYRSRTAAQMSIAADKARAGEKAKSEFLAVMSHELRTPLNGILGLADFLSRTAPTEDLREKNKIILNSGQDLLGLVENILDMTLIEGDDIHPLAEEVNIRALLHKLEDKWRETITEKDIIFTSFIDPYVPAKMTLDPRRTTQCIDNLLSNAAKFTMAGRIHMHITAKDIQSSNETELTIIIADTGTGISDDAQTRLFQPFVQADSSMTRHFGGAGLGLAIARSLAKLMGGDITVVSREKRGSEFTLSLRSKACVQEDEQLQTITQPIATQKTVTGPTAPAIVSTPMIAEGASTPAQHETPRYKVPLLDHLNILIVDDDIPCQDVLKTILTPTKCRMDCAGDGNIALTKLSQNTYDLVLMDIRMPGMDGVTAVRHIRQSRDAHNHVPIIAVTADVSAETNIKCMAAGVDIFLTKPVRAQELLDAISYVTQEDRTIQTA